MNKLLAFLTVLLLAACATSTAPVATAPITVAPPAKPPVVSTLPPAHVSPGVQVRTWKATHTAQQILDVDHISGGRLTMDGVHEQAAAALAMYYEHKPIPKGSALLYYNTAGIKNDLDVAAFEKFYGLANTIESPSLGE